MNNLYISLFEPSDPKRKKELMYCLKKNMDVFDQVFILTESKVKLIKSDKIILLPTKKRPTFKMFFRAINHTAKPGELNVIANADIYFEPSTKPLVFNRNSCFALTRWEHDTKEFMHRSDSQDAWIFFGHVQQIEYMHCSFPLGIPGCDNRIAWELRQVGYNVTNPSLTIKTFHVHSNHKEHDRSVVVPMPYLKLEPVEL
jgi:hypothetical protein